MEDPLKMLDDLICYLTQPPGHLIIWPNESEWTGGEVEHLLRGFGVRCWGRKYATGDNNYGITVRKRQLRWAEQILHSYGVLVLNPQYTIMGPGKIAKRWGAKALPVGLSGVLTDIIGYEPAALRSTPISDPRGIKSRVAPDSTKRRRQPRRLHGALRRAAGLAGQIVDWLSE
jgi:hypothetical protein